MDVEVPSGLQLPCFLRGPFTAVEERARAEGQRCAEHHQREGSFPAPRAMCSVAPGEEVVVHPMADPRQQAPVWRLYLSSTVVEGLCDALEWRDAFQVSDLHEAFSRETPGGALHAAIAQEAPRSTARTALRLRAVLRFWAPLQSARYLYQTPGTSLSLEDLLVASHDWALRAWGPMALGPVRARLEEAVERMLRATREDIVEVLLRELPRVLPLAKGLRHRERFLDPVFIRERLLALDAPSFDRLSGACPADLLERVYAWDQELSASVRTS